MLKEIIVLSIVKEASKENKPKNQSKSSQTFKIPKETPTLIHLHPTGRHQENPIVVMPQQDHGRAKKRFQTLCSAFLPFTLTASDYPQPHPNSQNCSTCIQTQPTELLLLRALPRFQELTPHFNAAAPNASFFPSFLWYGIFPVLAISSYSPLWAPFHGAQACKVPVVPSVCIPCKCYVKLCPLELPKTTALS